MKQFYLLIIGLFLFENASSQQLPFLNTQSDFYNQFNPAIQNNFLLYGKIRRSTNYNIDFFYRNQWIGDVPEAPETFGANFNVNGINNLFNLRAGFFSDKAGAINNSQINFNINLDLLPKQDKSDLYLGIGGNYGSFNINFNKIDGNMNDQLVLDNNGSNNSLGASIGLYSRFDLGNKAKGFAGLSILQVTNPIETNLSINKTKHFEGTLGLLLDFNKLHLEFSGVLRQAQHAPVNLGFSSKLIWEPEKFNILSIGLGSINQNLQAEFLIIHDTGFGLGINWTILVFGDLANITDNFNTVGFRGIIPIPFNLN